MIRFNDLYLKDYIEQSEYDAIGGSVEKAHLALVNRDGAGSDFLGWLDLPSGYDRAEHARIREAARRIRGLCEVFVVIGIGGSYLGARSAIELLKGQEHNLFCRSDPQIFFAGNNISADYLNRLLEYCRDRSVCIDVVSKSGTTTEPALAFRAFYGLMREKYSAQELRERIFITTDARRGTLRRLADESGYETFVIPDDIGGRYSVLSAPGLLPMEVAGIDTAAALGGARQAMADTSRPDIGANDCYKYAAARNILYRKGKAVELLVGFEPDFTMTVEWFKQLYGESEGKDGKGIYPSGVIFSTDLHSLGQFIQQGTRNLFETFMDFKKSRTEYIVKASEGDPDGLNYLAGKGVSYVNRMAMRGTLEAHRDGGVPCIVLESEGINEFEYGYMVYFFEKACAVSGYILGVNPFDQPGVEFYKRNMFKLLGKSR